MNGRMSTYDPRADIDLRAPFIGKEVRKAIRTGALDPATRAVPSAWVWAWAPGRQPQRVAAEAAQAS
jgi:hypothetical protein